mgnify:CR=1 FL=1
MWRRHSVRIGLRRFSLDQAESEQGYVRPNRYLFLNGFAVSSTGDSPDSTAFSPAVLLIEQRFFHRTVPDETLDGVGSRTPDTGTHRDLAGKGEGQGVGPGSGLQAGGGGDGSGQNSSA